MKKEVSDKEAELYLYAIAPDRQAHAVPLKCGSPQAVEQSARAMAEILHLPIVRASLPPLSLAAEGSFAGNFEEYRARQQRIAEAAGDPTSAAYDPAAARTIAKQVRVLREFGSLPSPPAWLLSPDHRTVFRQLSTAERTVYPADDLAAVEVEPEKLGEESGKGRDTSYLYAYRVLVTLKSGERHVFDTLASSERTRTEDSGASCDARWIADGLRRTLQLP